MDEGLGASVVRRRDGASLIRPFKPRERTIFFLEFEMLNLRPNEMTGDARHDLQEPAIGNCGYALNLSL
jgi:hypothetical protein